MLEDIGNVVLVQYNGMLVLVKDVVIVIIGIVLWLGEFGYQDQDDVVEGVIFLCIGEKIQDVFKWVEVKMCEFNDYVLLKDVKIVLFYDCSDLISCIIDVVCDNLVCGMLLVVVVLVFFLYDLCVGLIVVIMILLVLLFVFVCFDLQGVLVNLLLIGVIDFGILVDVVVVMVENIYCQLVD